MLSLGRLAIVLTAVCLFGALVYRANSLPPPAPVETVAEDPADDGGTAQPEVLSVSDAVFRDGRWFIADGRAHRIHLLDSTGVLLRSIGRRGRGPGEFIGPTVVAATAMGFYVAERGRPDVSQFDSAGRFVQLLHATGACASGSVVAMGSVGNELYVMRRCVELPERIRYEVERVRTGRLEVWTAVADTFHILDGGGVPAHFPLLAVGSTRLAVGFGDSGCLRFVRLPDGTPEGTRCATEVARVAFPAAERVRLARRWRGKVTMPEYLPRIRRVLLLDSSFAVQAVESPEQTTWLELSWPARPSSPKIQVGRAHVEESFLSREAQLVVRDHANGIRLEVVRVGR